MRLSLTVAGGTVDWRFGSFDFFCHRLQSFPLELQPVLADFEIPVIDDLRQDVGAILELEGQQIGLAVFHFVDGELLRGRRFDVGELVVVVDRRDIEGRFAAIAVIELQRLRGIIRTELFNSRSSTGLSKLRLGARRIDFAGGNQFGRAVGGGKRRRVGRLDHDLQVGVAGLDVIERERIHRAFVGNQIEVGVDAFFCRMQETVVAHGVDNPEVLVAGGDLQNLLRLRQLNQRGVAHLGVNADDVVGVVADDAGLLLTVGNGGNQTKHQRKDDRRFIDSPLGCVGLG